MLHKKTPDIILAAKRLDLSLPLDRVAEHEHRCLLVFDKALQHCPAAVQVTAIFR